MRRRRLTLFFVSVTLASLMSFAIGQDLEERVVEHTLDNGLKILMLERHQAPVVAMLMFFRGGSVDEETGRTGIAHLLEHMLFKGTKTIGTKDYEREKPIMEEIDVIAEALDAERAKGDRADKNKLETLQRDLKTKQAEQRKWMIADEFEEIYARHGAASMNAFTGADCTGYVTSLPSNKLELWAAMESDRMANPVLREFYVERDVVTEERRLGDNWPVGKLREQFQAAAFVAHPYRNPVVGWMSDISTVKRKDAEEFFRIHYAPNTAAVAIVGDINPPEVIKLVEKYFSGIPAQPPRSRLITSEPKQEGERRVEVLFDAEPQLIMGYHKPALPHRDNYVFDVIAAILSRGRTSRFHLNLIEGQELAVSAYASNGNPGDRYDNLFVAYATPRHPHGAEELEKAILAELEKLKEEPVREEDLEKVRNQVEADFVRSLASNRYMAYQLSYNMIITGSWRHILEYQKAIRSVTAEDIMRVAKEYLIKSNRTVATLVKK
jgi:predicted Zn-dependent peptidase